MTLEEQKSIKIDVQDVLITKQIFNICGVRLDFEIWEILKICMILVIITKDKIALLKSNASIQQMALF